jgi:hypothetical protein
LTASDSGRPESDPAAELRIKQRMADATKAWIACARANGYPSPDDITPVADHGHTSPEAVLPFSTTPDQVRELNADGQHYHDLPDALMEPNLAFFKKNADESPMTSRWSSKASASLGGALVGCGAERGTATPHVYLEGRSITSVYVLTRLFWAMTRTLTVLDAPGASLTVALVADR